MGFDEQLEIYLRARFTLIVVVTTEEERALAAVRATCERTGRPCQTWDLAEGLHALVAGGATPAAARDPLSALEHVDKLEGDTLFVLTDFHDCWTNAQVKRKLRTVAQRLKYSRKS